MRQSKLRHSDFHTNSTKHKQAVRTTGSHQEEVVLGEPAFEFEQGIVIGQPVATQTDITEAVKPEPAPAMATQVEVEDLGEEIQVDKWPIPASDIEENHGEEVQVEETAEYKAEPSLVEVEVEDTSENT